MTRAAPRHRFLAWVPEEWLDEGRLDEATLPDNVRLHRTRRGLHRKVWSENVTIRHAIASWGADVLFSLGDTSLPLCPVPHLLLVQQAYLAYGPRDRDFDLPRRARARWLAMELYLRACLPTVTRVTVQTADMRRRLAERYAFPAARIDVVPSGVDQDLLSRKMPAEPVGGPPFVCYVSSPGHHKNHVVLAPMMAALQHRFPDLVCRVTGSESQFSALADANRRLGVAERFVFEGTVRRTRALQLARDAKVVVMPSKLESFGIPYYEALALGAALVVADRAFAREACGDAALYAPADDGEAFAAATAQVLLDRGAERELRAAARTRAERKVRSWETVARAYLRILEQLAGWS